MKWKSYSRKRVIKEHITLDQIRDIHSQGGVLLKILYIGERKHG